MKCDIATCSMLLGELMSVTMMQLILISDHIKLGSHTHDGTPKLAMNERELLSPKVVKVLHYVLREIQLYKIKFIRFLVWSIVDKPVSSNFKDGLCSSENRKRIDYRRRFNEFIYFTKKRE